MVDVEDMNETTTDNIIVLFESVNEYGFDDRTGNLWLSWYQDAIYLAMNVANNYCIMTEEGERYIRQAYIALLHDYNIQPFYIMSDPADFYENILFDPPADIRYVNEG